MLSRPSGTYSHFLTTSGVSKLLGFGSYYDCRNTSIASLLLSIFIPNLRLLRCVLILYWWSAFGILSLASSPKEGLWFVVWAGDLHLLIIIAGGLLFYFLEFHSLPLWLPVPLSYCCIDNKLFLCELALLCTTLVFSSSIKSSVSSSLDCSIITSGPY